VTALTTLILVDRWSQNRRSIKRAHPAHPHFRWTQRWWRSEPDGLVRSVRVVAIDANGVAIVVQQRRFGFVVEVVARGQRMSRLRHLGHDIRGNRGQELVSLWQVMQSCVTVSVPGAAGVEGRSNRFFIDRYNRRFKKSIRGITDETRRLIFTHNWPGNVRELKNTIERGMILEDEPFLRPAYLPFSVGESGGRTVFERTSPANGGQTLPNGRTLPRLYIPEGGSFLEEVEHSMVELAMRRANGKQTRAAKLLDISRDALRYKLRKIGLIRGDDEASQANVTEE
jgi:hypothetical protein